MLLPAGPVVLRGVLPEPLYENFILLCVGITILVTPRLCQIQCDYASQLLTVCAELDVKPQLSHLLFTYTC